MAPDQFPSFELIPAESDTFSPDQELAVAAGLYDLPPTLLPDDTNPLGSGWRLKITDGTDAADFAPTPVYGIDELVQVLMVAMNTRRGESPLLPPDFGMDDPNRLIGWVDDPEQRADFMRDVEQTLLAAHERVTSVGSFLFTQAEDSDNALEMSCELVVDDQALGLTVQVSP